MRKSPGASLPPFSRQASGANPTTPMMVPERIAQLSLPKPGVTLAPVRDAFGRLAEQPWRGLGEKPCLNARGRRPFPEQIPGRRIALIVGTGRTVIWVAILFFLTPTLARLIAQVSPDDLVNRGLSKYDAGDVDGAIADYNRALTVNPNFLRAIGNRALAKEAKRDYAGALADYDRVLAQDPKSLATYLNRGVLKMHMGDFEGAIADETKALELEPKSPEAYANRSDMKKKMGDYRGAIADATRAIELTPNESVFYINRSAAKLGINDLDGAVADANRAIALNSRQLLGYINRGLANARRGHLDGAIADATRAIEQSRAPSDTALAYNFRGALKINKNDIDGTIADCGRAIELEQSADAYLNRGSAKQKKNDFAGARMDYQESLRRGNGFAAIELFFLESELGQRTAGERILEGWLANPTMQPLTSSTDEADYKWTIEKGRFLAGKITLAALLDRALAADEPFVRHSRLGEAWYVQGMLYKFSGQRDAAIRSFRQALITQSENMVAYMISMEQLEKLEIDQR